MYSISNSICAIETATKIKPHHHKNQTGQMGPDGSSTVYFSGAAHWQNAIIR